MDERRTLPPLLRERDGLVDVIKIHRRPDQGVACRLVDVALGLDRHRSAACPRQSLLPCFPGHSPKSRIGAGRLAPTMPDPRSAGWVSRPLQRCKESAAKAVFCPIPEAGRCCLSLREIARRTGRLKSSAWRGRASRPTTASKFESLSSTSLKPPAECPTSRLQCRHLPSRHAAPPREPRILSISADGLMKNLAGMLRRLPRARNTISWHVEWISMRSLSLHGNRRWAVGPLVDTKPSMNVSQLAKCRHPVLGVVRSIGEDSTDPSRCHTIFWSTGPRLLIQVTADTIAGSLLPTA